MLGQLFGFRDRLGRLAYFGWICGGGLLWAFGVFLLVGGAFATSLANGSIGALVGASLTLLLSLIPLVWMGLALATKRLRDAGIPPLLVVPAVAAFSVFDVLVLSRQTGGQPLAGFVHNSPVGLCVNLAYGLVLLFWPSAGTKGRSDDGEARHTGDVPWHERALTLASSVPVQHEAGSYPSQIPLRGQPRTFGRRTA
ncbi:DUF805 domain-containing protein [Methylobacterium haplocladii]|uniref:DUF805 domain-containing protein n=1 Tax=Methylobacterium haplocladii TaxID=1176176 RepID=A0A512IUA1_9HYPH|nr:DUF805 domain-containing protein [Methylobacterium haplocladii]GEP01284.1 hypothetical protein MHA02_36710 [Methylobacterium haplocladii]GJD86120.1 hypothetical protein HPGCJGGD_4017 [Methylobacterium haplocladii]GLS60438.1 hypothetical protein GCM10007887_31170 [Methylobacterium haplocladii]